jgi:hypothetical protein
MEKQKEDCDKMNKNRIRETSKMQETNKEGARKKNRSNRQGHESKEEGYR